MRIYCYGCLYIKMLKFFPDKNLSTSFWKMMIRFRVRFRVGFNRMKFFAHTTRTPMEKRATNGSRKWSNFLHPQPCRHAAATHHYPLEAVEAANLRKTRIVSKNSNTHTRSLTGNAYQTSYRATRIEKNREPFFAIIFRSCEQNFERVRFAAAQPLYKILVGGFNPSEKY